MGTRLTVSTSTREVHQGQVAYFARNFRQYLELAKEVEAAVIMGNHFKSPMKLINHSEGDVQIGLNASDKK